MIQGVLWDVGFRVDVRINVIGASGSGASTLGKSLAQALAVPHFDSDDYYHLPTNPPFQRQRPAEERYRLISRDLRPGGNWVLSGGVVGWEPYPALAFTSIVFLYVPTETRLSRLRLRERLRFGHRILEGGDMHRAHEEFVEWASRYDIGDVDGKTLARHEDFLKSQSCPVLEYRGVGSVEELTASVLASIRGP